MVNLNGTIFAPMEGRDLFNATFSEHSVTEYFPLLLEDGKAQEIDEELGQVGITRVAVFDELGDNVWNMDALPELTLLILPSVQEADEKGKSTKEWIRDHSAVVRKKYYPIDIHTQENIETKYFATYFVTRNLIITHFNPFYDCRGWEFILHDIQMLEAEFKDPEALALEILARQWKLNFKNTINRKERDLSDNERNIEHYRQEYLNSVSNVERYTKELEYLKDIGNNSIMVVKEKIEELKALPFIQEVIVSDVIKFTFGDVYCTGSVITGTNSEGESIREARKVYIGELWFTIKDGHISIDNDDALEGHEHPHCQGHSPCYGSIDLDIGRLIREFDFVQLAKFLYSWAFSYNSKDRVARTWMQNFYQKQKEKEEQETSMNTEGQ